MNTNQFKEVDERFDAFEYALGVGATSPAAVIREWLEWYKEKGTDRGDFVIAEESITRSIKSFLHTELLNERKRVLEEVLGGLPKWKPAHTYASENAEMYRGFDRGFKDCLSQIRDSITKQLEKSP